MVDPVSLVRNYQSMDVRHDDTSQTEAIHIAVSETTEVDHQLCQLESRPEVTPYSRVALVMFQFLASQSYIGTLIIMMVSCFN